jgi:hypothetical protein
MGVGGVRIVLTDNLTSNFFPYYISEIEAKIKKVTWGDLVREIDSYYLLIEDIPETLAIYVRDSNIKQFLSSKLNVNFTVYSEDYVYEPGDHIFIILLTKEPIDESNLTIYKMVELETNSMGFEARDLEKMANMMKELAKACEEDNHNEKVKIAEMIMDKFELKVYESQSLDQKEPAIIVDDTCIPYLYIPKILKKGE